MGYPDWTDEDRLIEVRRNLEVLYSNQGGDPHRWVNDSDIDAIVMLSRGILFGWRDI